MLRETVDDSPKLTLKKKKEEFIPNRVIESLTRINFFLDNRNFSARTILVWKGVLLMSFRVFQLGRVKGLDPGDESLLILLCSDICERDQYLQ